jgi:hypothetical protein
MLAGVSEYNLSGESAARVSFFLTVMDKVGKLKEN